MYAQTRITCIRKTCNAIMISKNYIYTHARTKSERNAYARNSRTTGKCANNPFAGQRVKPCKAKLWEKNRLTPPGVNSRCFGVTAAEPELATRRARQCPPPLKSPLPGYHRFSHIFHALSRFDSWQSNCGEVFVLVASCT